MFSSVVTRSGVVLNETMQSVRAGRILPPLNGPGTDISGAMPRCGPAAVLGQSREADGAAIGRPRDNAEPGKDNIS